jgi:glycosyltransferase involved in cell wall biosynthesis
VSLLPVYTPTRTDEENVSRGRVFFGGISVYLQQHLPLFRRTPAFLDKIWDSAAVIKAFADRSASTDPTLLGELTVSMLRGEEGFQAKEVRKLLRWLAEAPSFDVISLPFSLLLGLAPPLKRETGRPIVCTLQGEDLFLEGLGEPHRSEAKALIAKHAPAVDAFAAVSDYYAGFMSHYLGIPRDRIHTVPLGINLSGHDASRPPRSGPFTLGFLARVAPEKGLHLLAEAYRVLRRERGLPPSRLEVAGYLRAEHRGYLAQIESRLGEWGLLGEYRYHGEVPRDGKIRFLQSIDVLSVPSPYVEPKGLYLLEAMANGVPVVQPRHGAFPEIIEKTGGGLLFEPGSVSSLADGIQGIAEDPAQARELGRRGAAGVREHYGAARMAERALDVFRGRTAREEAVAVAEVS